MAESKPRGMWGRGRTKREAAADLTELEVRVLALVPKHPAVRLVSSRFRHPYPHVSVECSTRRVANETAATLRERGLYVVQSGTGLQVWWRGPSARRQP
jgi:hypothetical protein